MALFGKPKKEIKSEENKKAPETKVTGLPQGKDPKLYLIVKKPIVTEKAVGLSANNQYVFKVWQKTNKIEIRKAVEKLYDVKVKKVKTAKTPAKSKQVGRFQGQKPGFKKAIVTLKEGHKIEITP